mmetsp:Transcript_40075/g.114204  ORF Transcript_40075/g.114204 Transcript_40075/m.114204 type:complete len:299 (+) Transcript_40075:2226-3122(+)
MGRDSVSVFFWRQLRQRDGVEGWKEFVSFGRLLMTSTERPERAAPHVRCIWMSNKDNRSSITCVFIWHARGSQITRTHPSVTHSQSSVRSANHYSRLYKASNHCVAQRDYRRPPVGQAGKQRVDPQSVSQSVVRRRSVLLARRLAGLARLPSHTAALVREGIILDVGVLRRHQAVDLCVVHGHLCVQVLHLLEAHDGRREGRAREPAVLVLDGLGVVSSSCVLLVDGRVVSVPPLEDVAEGGGLVEVVGLEVVDLLLYLAEALLELLTRLLDLLQCARLYTHRQATNEQGGTTSALLG